MGEDPDVIPEREMKDFQFRQMKKIRVFAAPELMPRERSSLLAVSNKYGLTCAGSGALLKLFLTRDIIAANRVEGNPNEIVETVKGLCVPVTFPMHHLALSCDELTLSVCTVSSESGLKISFYDVRSLLNKARKEKLPFADYRPPTGEGTAVQDLKWNPAVPSLLAVCLSDGSMCSLEVTDGVKLLAQLPPSTGVTCVCWSPKGKQVAAGKQNATVIQYSHTLQEKKVIPCPNFYSSDNPVKVLDILWLSTYVFAVTYAAADGALETPPDLVVVSLPKKEEKKQERYLNFSDLVYGSCTERQHHYFLSHIEDWDIVLAASAASIEVSIIAKQEDKTNWELWLLEDASRAELPVTLNNDDTLPVGVAIDYTSQEQIPIGDEKTLPPAPVLMLLSTDGVLCPFYLINQNPGAKQLSTLPVSLSLDGERQPKAGTLSHPPPSAVVPAGPPGLRPPASAPVPPIPPGSSAPAPSTGLSTGFSFAPSVQNSAAPSAFSLSSTMSKASPATPSLGAAAFSFASPTSKPLPAAPSPSASAFSFSAPPAKPPGEGVSAPSVPATPASSFKSSTEIATPAVKVNLNDRFSAVETPAPPIAGPPQFSFASLPKAAFPSPVNQSTPLPSAKTALASGAPAAARPVQTVTTTAMAPKPGPAPQAPGRTATPQPPLSVKALEKQLQHRKETDPVMAGILEEIAHFQKELDDLKSRTEKADFKVGSTQQMKELRKESEDLHTFILEIKETTESLHGDISTLKTTMLEGFAGAEEAKSQNELNKDRGYLQLLYKKPLDPRSEDQLKEIRRLYQYIKFAVEDVNDVLDLEWEKHLEKKKKKKHLIVPEREALFSALANHLDIINQQKQKLAVLVTSLQDLRLYNKTSQWSVPSQPSTHATEQGLDIELESLRNALVKASLETTSKTSSKSPAKMSPVKQSQLRNFLSKRQTPPVRSTAPANLSRSAFLSPKFYEDLDDVSSTSSVSQALDLEDPQAGELEEAPIPVPRHPTVVRTPSIQPGYSPQSTPFSKIHAGLSSVISPVPTNKISAGGADSTAFVTKTVKHGAPPSERSLPVTLPAQQAAAAAAMRRQMANQKPVLNTSLTESTLKNVPQVVNVQELKDKGPALPVSTVLSSSVPPPAAQVVQQVLATVATNQAKRTQNSSQNTLKASGPTSGSLPSLQPGFVFGGPAKNEAPVASSTGPVLGEQTSKAFSFASAPSGGFGFSSLNATSAATSQGSGNTQGKDANLLSKFSFSSSTGKMMFGSVGDGSFSFAPKSTPPMTSGSSAMAPALSVSGEAPSGTKPASPAPLAKADAPPSKPASGFSQPVGAGETLGSFSGLRVGQGEEEAVDTGKSVGFSFGQVDKSSSAGSAAEFSFASPFQHAVTKEADSSSDGPKPVAPFFGSTQVPAATVSSGAFKPAEPTASTMAKPGFSFAQTSSTTAPSASPAVPAIPSLSSLLTAPTLSSSSTPSSNGEAKHPATTMEPSATREPVLVPLQQPADRESVATPPSKPAEEGMVSSTSTLPTDASSAARAAERFSTLPTPPSPSPSPAPAPSPAPISAATGTPSVESTPASDLGQPPSSTPSPATPSGAPPPYPQQPSVFGQPPNSDKPGSIFTQLPVSTQGTTLAVAAVTQAITTSAPAATPTSAAAITTSTPSGFGQTAVVATTTATAPATSGFGSSGFGSAAGFGNPVFGQTGGFGQQNSGPASGFSFGAPSFGSGVAFGQATASTPVSSTGGLFGSSGTNSANSFSFGQLAAGSTNNTNSGTGGVAAGPATAAAAGGGGAAGLFGQSTGTPSFGNNTGFGQTSSMFGSNTTTTSSTGFSFGQPAGFGNSSSTSVFGQQSTGGSVFGQQQQQPSAGGGLFGAGNSGGSTPVGGGAGGGGFFSGLGGKPSEDAANKNPFGAPAAGGFGQVNQAAGSTSLFGNSGAKAFGFGGGTSFGDQKASGTFSTGGGSVAAQGFGSFASPPKSGGFGGAPVFGSPPAFGGSPAFGGAPAFGSTPTFNSPLGPSSAGKVFGEGTAAASVGGFGFASASSAPSFGSLANQNTPSFGNLAQQGSGFGAQSSTGFSGFGTSGGAFTSGGFGTTNQLTPRWPGLQ
ncbi:nuclear pore complex protein Nup214 isoform X1 [Amia ocellicauda]|uniref:nuclear pore complex protein Nup214 isoform X1 n=1 Tax=Amia ocellicauda TaxID=2972642 RepID=UPI003464CB91